MKKFILLVYVLIALSSCERYHPMTNEHIIYEGQIPCYSEGPTFYPTKNIKMELWFHLNETVHGYWQEKGKSHKHYLCGEIYKSRRKQRKEDSKTFEDYKEMAKPKAYYRIKLYEYRDEHFSDKDIFDPVFYIYNFENGMLKGQYYTPVTTMMTNGKDTWSSGFNVKISLTQRQN